jgi:signal transduction histidine kinase
VSSQVRDRVPGSRGRRLPGLGLRLRVALAIALACMLVVAALGITLYTAVEDLEDALVEELIQDEASYLLQRYRADPHLPRVSGGSFLKTYVVRTAADEAALPAYVRGLGTGNHEIHPNDREFHIAVRDAGDARLYVVYDAGLHEQRVNNLRLLILMSVVAIALASAALSYWLSGLLVNQVTELARRVGRLKPGETIGPLAQPGQDEEVALLARAFAAYQARIEEMLQREQEFTANASHELRTPLTAIRTSCELLAADPTLGEKARRRVAMIDAAVERMTEQLRTLLFLAREHERDSVESLSLAAFVAETAEPYRSEIGRKGLQLEMDVDEGATLTVDARALHLALSNLIRNAVQYTERGFVRISYAGRRLTVSDSGAGIAPEHLPRLFERFYRADAAGSGLGIGLAIVKRICDRYGWRIEVQSRPGEGSAFSIVFP